MLQQAPAPTVELLDSAYRSSELCAIRTGGPGGSASYTSNEYRQTNDYLQWAMWEVREGIAFAANAQTSCYPWTAPSGTKALQLGFTVRKQRSKDIKRNLQLDLTEVLGKIQNEGEQSPWRSHSERSGLLVGWISRAVVAGSPAAAHAATIRPDDRGRELQQRRYLAVSLGIAADRHERMRAAGAAATKAIRPMRAAGAAVVTANRPATRTRWWQASATTGAGSGRRMLTCSPLKLPSPRRTGTQMLLISTLITDIAMQAPELPLPNQLKVRQTGKTGDHLTACRDKLAPINFIFQVATGCRGVRGAVEEMFGRHLPNVWRQAFDLYLKPSNNAPQRDFFVIQAGEHEFNVQLESVWDTAPLRKNGQSDIRLMVCVYVPRPQRATTLRRATAARVEEQTPRIAAFVREHAIDAGPATLRYISVRQARLPDEARIQTPDDTMFRQLQWIDQQEVDMQAAQDEADHVSNSEYHAVRAVSEGTPIALRLNIADLRLALGLSSYSLRPPYRSPPTTVIPDPGVDMEDVDRRQQDG
ncbi:hypothetical protein ON010_g14905 [Phytophthora cinnamomi]|nr:hypothetical protein ON010_g14905 [Phytophthora cinnamomi]